MLTFSITLLIMLQTPSSHRAELVQIHNDYTVGWICALDTEYTAARQFLDETHHDAATISKHDNNSYALCRMGSRNVAIAVLPDGEYGKSSAMRVARDMLSSLPNIKIGLLVGIGVDAPTLSRHIRLGDVVVNSASHGTGVVY